MSTSSPTSGLGVVSNLALSGLNVVQVIPATPGKPGGSTYAVSLSLSNSPTVSVNVIAEDVTGAAVGEAPGSVLASAANFAILAQAAITGSAGAGSVVSGGNIGIYPNDASSVTNFPPSVLTAPGVFDYANATAEQALLDALTAYNYYGSLTPTLSGLSDLSTGGNGATESTYNAGVYASAPASSLDIPTSITLDAQGNPNAVFVFIAGSTITLESGASVLLVNGASAANVYWVVGSSFTSIWNESSSTMVGTILANTSITLGGGVLNGRALAGVVAPSGAVTIATTETVTSPSLIAANARAVSYNAPEIYSSPTWYRPSPGSAGGATYNPNIASVSDAGNPFLITALSPGSAQIDFQVPTFDNEEGTDGNVAGIVDGFAIDMITASLLVTVTV
jgi:hypothetical protein